MPQSSLRKPRGVHTTPINQIENDPVDIGHGVPTSHAHEEQIFHNAQGSRLQAGRIAPPGASLLVPGHIDAVGRSVLVNAKNTDYRFVRSVTSEDTKNVWLHYKLKVSAILAVKNNSKQLIPTFTVEKKTSESKTEWEYKLRYPIKKTTHFGTISVEGKLAGANLAKAMKGLKAKPGPEIGAALLPAFTFRAEKKAKLPQTFFHYFDTIKYGFDTGPEELINPSKFMPFRVALSRTTPIFKGTSKTIEHSMEVELKWFPGPELLAIIGGVIWTVAPFAAVFGIPAALFIGGEAELFNLMQKAENQGKKQQILEAYAIAYVYCVFPPAVNQGKTNQYFAQNFKAETAEPFKSAQERAFKKAAEDAIIVAGPHLAQLNEGSDYQYSALEAYRFILLKEWGTKSDDPEMSAIEALHKKIRQQQLEKYNA